MNSPAHIPHPISNRLPTPYREEASVVSSRLAALQGALDWSAIASAATPWVQAVRDNPPPFWAMESLLREYPLSSAEGLALMRLAEALLRIPDADTAIALTADQLATADFESSGNGALKRLSNAAIGMSKHFLPGAAEPAGIMAKLGAKTVVAATLRAVQLMGKQFVLGQTIGDALDEAAAQRKKSPVVYSYDMLGEGARTQLDADRYFESYSNAINTIANYQEDMPATAPKGSKNATQASPMAQDGISIKLSALHPRYEWSHASRVTTELVPRVWQLCELAARANMNLTIDAEEVDRLELSLDVFDALLAKVAAHHPQWQGLGLALQAYQTRAVELIDEVARMARAHGVRLMCRLVKGAYWDAEIKRAQEMGLAHYPVFTHKHHTDVSYLACAQAMLKASDVIYAQFATHNAATIAAIAQLAQKTFSPHSASPPPEGVPSSLGRPGAAFSAPYELQRLHGMGEGVYREVLKNPLIPLRIYAPVGAHRDLLAYLVRRLLENGANSSFVHQLTDSHVRIDELLASPVHLSAQPGQLLPANVYGTRKNSAGFDLACATHSAPMLAAYAGTSVPHIAEFDAKSVSTRHTDCLKCYQIWSKYPVEQRAKILHQAADALQDQMPKFCALLVKEAHKTWNDAIAEVREAVDFLRYYALEAERIMQPHLLVSPTGETNELRLKARGVWVCISPWNFPLAIFLGQVAAALATGNTVLAKPAEQTPAIAVEAAKLLHAAGVPEAALQVLHGPGETVGAALVALENIAGVVFTGSTQVAKIIHRALAAKDGPIIPLIAETGGINAMLVDSSALPEQVVDAAVQSAFKSAGQRCSALRLLCVHEAIAPRVIEMLQGAMQELQVGSSAEFSTDVGALIDSEAHQNIARYLSSTEFKRFEPLAGIPSTQRATNLGVNLIAPTLLEISSISQMSQEIFGPVLHVLRYSGDPQQVIEQINALGYGLTLGIQTRIDSRAQQLARSSHIGNVYINRNMIGAVVGVQPFGGEGLSGTGPKAGGPHYLYRFCGEQTITVNTAAAGGNATLLAGG